MNQKTKAISNNKNPVETAKKKTQPFNKILLSKKNKKTSKTKTGIKDSASLRKTAGKNLNKETAARYRSMIENIDNGYFEVDLAGNFTFFNEEVCRALGYTREELMGQNYRQHTDKETAKKVFQVYKKVYKTGKPVKEFGYNIIRKDGSKRYIESSVSLRKYSSGKPIGFLGISNDFTHRKQLEGALRKSEALYRLLADHMKDQIWLMDLNLKFKYISPSVEKLLGYTLKELNKIHLYNLLTEASFQKAMDIFSMEITRASTTPPPPSLKHILELECRCKDGRTLWIEGTHSFIQDKDGKPLSILGEGRDITERKKAEEALRQSEEKYRNILQNMQEGYFEVDLAGNYTFINDSLCRTHGYSKEELLGMNYRKYMDKEIAQKAFRFFNKVYQTDKPLKEVDWQILVKDGSKRHIELSVSLIKDSSGNPKGFKGVTRDITERKLMEEILRFEEQRFKAFVEHSLDIIVIMNREGIITYINPAVEKVLGFKIEERIGAKGFDLVHPDNMKFLADSFNTLIRDTNSPGRPANV